jgi:hypothetical protein
MDTFFNLNLKIDIGLIMSKQVDLKKTYKNIILIYLKINKLINP